MNILDNNISTTSSNHPDHIEIFTGPPKSTSSRKMSRIKRDEDGKFSCPNCDKTFVHRQSYHRHIDGRCKNAVANIVKTDDKIEPAIETGHQVTNIHALSIEKKMDDLRSQMSQMIQAFNEMQKGEKNNIMEIAKISAEATKISAEASKKSAETSTGSMHILKYAIKNFKNANPLKQLNNKDAIKLIEYKPDGSKASDKYPIEEIIIYEFGKSTLVNFVGKIIISCYSKDDPEMQSMWGVDVSRLTFIIKQCIGDGNESEWVRDYNGVKILKMIINPLYEEISSMMKIYTSAVYDSLKETGKCHTKTRNLIEKTKVAMNIVKEIAESKIQQKTLKFISPHFGFCKKEKIINKHSDEQKDDMRRNFLKEYFNKLQESDEDN